MSDGLITVNSLRFDGSVRRSWTCRLIEASGPLLRFVGEFDHDIDHPDLGLIRAGTISYEYYWLDRWYNIFRFQDEHESLRNYYCNISMPPTFVGDVVNYVDLDIDIVVWPDSTYQILDREEFAAAAAQFNYSQEIRDMVEATLFELTSMIERGDLSTIGRSFATKSR